MQDSSSIAACIQRFRYQAPTPSESRSPISKAKFWWLNSSVDDSIETDMKNTPSVKCDSSQGQGQYEDRGRDHRNDREYKSRERHSRSNERIRSRSPEERRKTSVFNDETVGDVSTGAIDRYSEKDGDYFNYSKILMSHEIQGGKKDNQNAYSEFHHRNKDHNVGVRSNHIEDHTDRDNVDNLDNLDNYADRLLRKCDLLLAGYNSTNANTSTTNIEKGSKKTHSDYNHLSRYIYIHIFIHMYICMYTYHISGLISSKYQ
jgi:hypothetical protein